MVCIHLHMHVNDLVCKSCRSCSVLMAGWQVADSSWRHDPLELDKGWDFPDLEIRIKLKWGSMRIWFKAKKDVNPKNVYPKISPQLAKILTRKCLTPMFLVSFWQASISSINCQGTSMWMNFRAYKWPPSDMTTTTVCAVAVRPIHRRMQCPKEREKDRMNRKFVCIQMCICRLVQLQRRIWALIGQSSLLFLLLCQSLLCFLIIVGAQWKLPDFVLNLKHHWVDWTLLVP